MPRLPPSRALSRMKSGLKTRWPPPSPGWIGAGRSIYSEPPGAEPIACGVVSFTALRAGSRQSPRPEGDPCYRPKQDPTTASAGVGTNDEDCRSAGAGLAGSLGRHDTLGVNENVGDFHPSADSNLERSSTLIGQCADLSLPARDDLKLVADRDRWLSSSPTRFLFALHRLVGRGDQPEPPPAPVPYPRHPGHRDGLGLKLCRF